MNKILMAAFGLAFALPAVATTAVCRDPGDTRAWSVMIGGSAPLAWCWAEGAVKATLTATSLVTGETVTAPEVVREGGAADGSCAVPLSGLVDVTLVQSDGSQPVDSRTVRLQIGPAENSVSTAKAARSFRRLPGPRIYSWSDAWVGAAAETATLATAQSGAAIGSWGLLPATGGFGVLRPDVEFAGHFGKVTASLSFDDEVAYASELNVTAGLLLFLR